MDGDLYLKGESPSSRRRTDERWWEGKERIPLPDLPYRRLPGGSWTRRAWEARRTATEQVRATFWSRGDEKVITLQWMVYGEDGDWHPCNIPPGPADLE